MKPLDPKAISLLVVHTAASATDVSVGDIRAWHLARGWQDIGYHYVIRMDGSIHHGRSTDYQGAHVAGLNHCSLGICCTGHGDKRPFTTAQFEALVGLLARLMAQHGIGADGVIGHREINTLIDAGLIDERYRTTKTCPGALVDMDLIRDRATIRLFLDTGDPKGWGLTDPPPLGIGAATEPPYLEPVGVPVRAEDVAPPARERGLKQPYRRKGRWTSFGAWLVGQLVRVLRR